jgi:hypothetical protein
MKRVGGIFLIAVNTEIDLTTKKGIPKRSSKKLNMFADRGSA